MIRDRGFVLVNALVLVAAMAAAAVFLLARAQTGHAQLQARQQAAQLNAYLDGFGALARSTLNRDAGTGDTDHTGEAWARSAESFALDRGEVAGTISDMQGRFNLNWLADPKDTAAFAAFDTLLAQIGVPDQAGDAITAFLSPGGPKNRSAYARLTPPLDPVGGALLHFDQMRGMPGLNDDVLDRLQPFAAALSGDSALNVNTAPAAVVTGFFPDTEPAVINAVLASRKLEPFASADAFLNAVEQGRGAALDDDFNRGRFAVASRWFEVTATARLGNSTGTRKTVLFRQSLPLGATETWRVTTYP